MAEAAPDDVKEMRKRGQKAFDDARPYHAELQEIHRYFMPFRQPTVQRVPDGGQGTAGTSRTNHLFDGSGISKAMNFAGTMQADWMPPHEPFFKIEAGPLVPYDQRKPINEALELLTTVAHAALAPVHPAAHEMFYDYFAGTGALLINPAERWDNRNVLRALAVSALELAIQDGPFGDPWHVFWKRTRKACEIEAEWPNADISDDLAQVIRQNRDADVEVTQYTYFDYRAGLWRLVVWTDKCKPEHAIWREDLGDTSPWIIARMFKVPGETFGRGLGHLGLPGSKTMNKTRELALTAAAFAVMGLWMYRDDGVFNPDTASFQPLGMIPVSSTGGTLGPALVRLPVPQDFDITSIVMKDEREQLNQMLLDNELPEMQDRVRSPTEITARLRRYARQKGGIGARLSHELISPIVARTVDILERKGLAPVILDGRPTKSKLKLDQILMQVTVTSPAIAAQSAGKLEAATNWLQILGSLLGPQMTMLLAKRIGDLSGEMGRWAGVDERFIPSADEIRQAQQQIMDLAASQAQQPAKPPSPAEMQNGIVNGAMMQ